VENPRFLKKADARLKGLQRRLARQKRYGSNWKRTKQEIARLHRKVANQRNDFQHKLTALWVSRYGLIATETLRVKPMSAQGGSGKAGLKGMRGILQKLAYKAEEAGTRLVDALLSPRSGVVPTPRIKPSQTCPTCWRQEKKPLAQRLHSCPCGCGMPRDQAAAQVMLRWALGPWAHGHLPVPKGIYPRPRSPRTFCVGWS